MPIVESIYRNPSRWRAVIHTQDVRHGTAGCMLSLVLFAPLFVRQYGMGIMATVVLVYSLVIVPAVTNYFSPLKIIIGVYRRVKDGFRRARLWFSLKNIAAQLENFVVCLAENISSAALLFVYILPLPFLCGYHCFLPYVHGCYLALDGFRVTSNQVIFFMLCEKLLSPDARLSSLHFLLFYTVLAYLHKSLVTRQWSQSFYESNIQDFLRLTTWFIAVRLAKGVAMTFVLIIFTMQFNNVEPNTLFVAVTFVYFLLTQKKWSGNETLVVWFRNLQTVYFEEEEDYWIPFYIKMIPVAASLVPVTMLIPSQTMLCLIAVYTNIVAPIMLLKKEFEEHYYGNAISFLSFRKATKADLQRHTTCPVCLDSLRIGRVTPCNHVYHGVCLRNCLAVSNLCPMCKRSLLC